MANIQDVIDQISGEMKLDRAKVADAVSTVWDGLTPDEISNDEVTAERIEALRQEMHLRTRILACWYPKDESHAPVVIVGQKRRYELSMWEPSEDDIDAKLAEEGWRRVEPWQGRAAEVVRVEPGLTIRRNRNLKGFNQMSTQITWDFVEKNFFPLVVADARRAGMDTTGWAIDRREGPGRMFCRLAEDRSVATVWHRFTKPADADRFFQGVRWSLAHLPTQDAATPDEGTAQTPGSQIVEVTTTSDAKVYTYEDAYLASVKGQLDGLGEGNLFLLKIQNRSDPELAATSGLPITRDQLTRIAAILTEEKRP